MLLGMNTRMYGQMDRRTGRSREKEGQAREGVLKNRDGDTKTVFLRSKKGKTPLFHRSCLSVFNFSLYVRHMQCGQISTDRCSFTERRETHNRSLRQMGSALPKSERGVGKLDCWEVFRGKRRPAPGTRGEPSTQRQRVPAVHYPVTLCLSLRTGSPVISRSALTGSRREGNRASLAHLAFPPTPGGV